MGQVREPGEKGKENRYPTPLSFLLRGISRKRQRRCHGQESSVSLPQFLSSFLPQLRTPPIAVWSFHELKAAGVCNPELSNLDKEGTSYCPEPSLLPDMESPPCRAVLAVVRKCAPDSLFLWEKPKTKHNFTVT